MSPDAFEDDVVSLQCLEVDSTWKGWVETLRQPLANCHPFWDDRVFHMVGEDLKYNILTSVFTK